MGLLGNLLSDAISAGVKNAVGKAVEKAVQPSMDNLAKKQAQQIDAASANIEQNTAELRQATAESKAEMDGAAQAGTGAAGGLGGALAGLAGLGSALGGLGGIKSSMEQYATEMSKSMKICPSCGEPCGADKEYCPKCGAKLPAETAAAAYTCPKCGEVNLPGSKHCGKCGAVLPGAEAEVRRQQENDAAVLSEFRHKLPQYPEWTVGGTGFELEADGMEDGHPLYRFSLDGRESLLYAYISKLEAAGFARTYAGSSTYVKEIGGEGFAFNCEEAYDDNHIGVVFYVDNSLVKKQQTEKQPEIDVAGLAKGLFKKLF